VSADPLQAVADAAADQAWLVGGAVRDRLLGRPTRDYDVVVAGAPAPLARVVARRAAGHAFELSEAFGAWRVVAHDHSWQLDVLGLGPETLEQDLARRDLTVNAIAQPLSPGGEPAIDPFDGIADLRARRLRMVSPTSFADDPLRVLRLARLVAQLGFAADLPTVARARASAAGLASVAPERTFAELRGLICAAGALDGLALMDEVGATSVILPELAALHGVEQSDYHHLDVYGHTTAVLAETIALVDDPVRLGLPADVQAALTAALSQPLANELTRGQALRVAALLHDIAKPRTREVTAEGRVTFMGHDALGAELASEILGRLRTAERLRAHVAALTRHHLRLGFLVHEMPLSRRAIYHYLDRSRPVGVDVSVLSVADRLATRGRNSGPAIDRHLELARQMIGDALDFEADPPRPPLRGDELAGALDLAPGPRIGALLDELTAAAFTGEAADREQAVALARRLIASGQV
jgi:poly(A) polymerase